MIKLLATIFIKDEENMTPAMRRKKYGVLSGALGIVLNTILFGIKAAAGLISGSIAVISDAFNNLTDAGSSLVTMIGFNLASQKPDSNHPYGHGRMEYITGFVMSVLIILMGVELLKTSIKKIITPEDVVFNSFTIVILILSIAVKMYMYFYNKKISEELKSVAIMAAAIDSFSDTCATCAVLLCLMISEYTGVNIDGYCGIAVSLFILYSGICAARDTIEPLLGSAPDPEFVETIEKYVATHDEIIGMHDLAVHDYGPGRMMISFHAEIPSSSDIMSAHDTIDNIESRLKEALGCEVVIHMDPIVTDDDTVNRMRNLTSLLVHGVDERLSMHDFRMVTGPTHTNLIFDVVVPYECPMTDEEVKTEIEKRVKELPGKHYAVVSIDKPLIAAK